MARKPKKKTPSAEDHKEDPQSGDSFQFLERLALFGDSGYALAGSFLLLLVAIAVSWYTDQSSPTTTTAPIKKNPIQNENVEALDDDFEALYQQLGPAPEMIPPLVLSVDTDPMTEIHGAYKQDGVVAVRGLISDSLLERLDKASRELIEEDSEQKKKQRNKQFHTMKHNPVFLDTTGSERDDTTINATNLTGQEPPEVSSHSNAFLEVSILGDVPKLAAQLMLPELQSGDSVRLLRDIFLAKDKEEFICGWHVDDFGFWPATASSPGINAWIALDDMPIAGGGGFALAVGSHAASWRDEAHYVTGATTFYPEEGFQSAADMFANRTGAGTCNIKTAAPHLYRRMEETKRVYELKRGDVIFHQRWLFHRTVPFERNYVKGENSSLIYRRYSVRYGPGSATIPPGFGTELSVLWDPSNGNRTADDVCQVDGPWYPRVFPSHNAEELQNLQDLIDNKLPIALERKLEKQKEMQPFLKQAARESQMKQSRKRKR